MTAAAGVADAAAMPLSTLQERLLSRLRAQAAGITEYELIKQLRADGVKPFAGSRLREPLSLFQTHFLLFHCLYRLRDRLAVQDEWVRIHCLDIGLETLATVPVGNRCPVASDPLRAYYLDLGRMETMDAGAVVALLGEFRTRMRRHGDARSREWALAELGLADPVRAGVIDRRYRQLVQRHHPDRGGDTATLQRLNAARRILLADAD
jgi:hypothetical protein